MLFFVFVLMVVVFVGAAIVRRSEWPPEEALHMRIFRRFVGVLVFASILCFFVLPIVILGALAGDCLLRSWGFETASDGYFCGETD